MMDRLPKARLSDNTGTTTRNELICFVQQKCGVMAVDHLVKLCADFYRNDEIMTARSCVELYVKDRIPKRQGAGSAKKTLEDIVKLCLDPAVKLPAFCATDLTRLPPVDATHCDVSVILNEIQALRAEVREVTQLRAELDLLKAEVSELSKLSSEVHDLKTQLAKLTDNPAASYLPTSPEPAAVSSFASVADAIARSAENGEKPFEVKSKSKASRRPQAICGKAQGQSTMAVDGIRRANIFMTRFCPETSAGDIQSLVTKVLPHVNSATVEKQKTRFDTYASFSVEICVSRSNFDELIGAIYSADTWPAGILVRRFYHSKHGNNQS